jgi:hypothetical protein
MKFAFAFAGIPNEIFDSISKEGKYITGSNTVAHFVRHGEYGVPYRSGEVRQLVNVFESYVAQEGEKESGDIAFAVFYIRNGYSDEVIRKGLFPFVLTVPVDLELIYNEKTGFRQSKNELAQLLNRLSTEARETLMIIHRELIEQRQRTPWLLPVRNFRSKHLVKYLYELQDLLPFNSQKINIFDRITNAFRHHHPPQKAQDGHAKDRRYFVDDAGIEFKPPGRDLHGFHRPSEGHNEICVVSSRRRMGVPYHRAFHYDCSKGNGPTQALLHSCHSEQVAQIDSEEHINIATNDYTRPES